MQPFTPIHAIFGGKVVGRRFVAKKPSYWGWALTIQGEKDSAFYTHMDRTIVSEGQTVKTGDIIGYVGKPPKEEGFTWPPHLHLAIKDTNKDLSFYIEKDGKIKNS